ncbi:MAG: ABC transporter permease [Myxococcales bacterium]|nr:ABC transporter permease [Myxococcales bacterium]
MVGLLGAAGFWRFAPAAVASRLASLAPSLLLLAYVTTWLMFLAPGSPFAGERSVAPHVEAALRERYGVPDNATAFYANYLRALIIEGSLGPALKVEGRSVGELLAPAIPVSLTLGLAALVLSLLLGLPLGVCAGAFSRRWPDYGASALATLGLSVPNFVIGAALLACFSLGLGWFPVAGWGTPAHLILPALTLALPHAAIIARLARGGLVAALGEDYIRTARAKGVSEVAVVLRHALRGALLPVVSFLGPAAAGILTGSFVVESLFGIPGVGQWFVKGAVNRDYAVVLGTSLFYATLVSSLNLAVDLLYAWVDPRLRRFS